MRFATEAKNVLGGQESVQTKLRDKVRDYRLQLKHQKPKVEKHLTKCSTGKFQIFALLHKHSKI